FAMDDDSNIARAIFPLYIDGPPPVPTIIRPTSGSAVFGANDTIYFEWHGLDKLDSMATYFEISISPAGTLNWTTIVPFSLASSPDFSVTDVNGTKHLTYKYRPAGLPLPSTYSYIWRIRSRDRCNSITTNESGSFSHN
ncbi:MAG TPA: hypothetical protein VKO63_04255, partial [Chitinispirillaceae bacterium]|nr:hypothetical protein [Chitinispirillaceae bacterium]